MVGTSPLSRPFGGLDLNESEREGEGLVVGHRRLDRQMPRSIEQDRTLQICGQRVAVFAYDAQEVEQIVRMEIENG